MTSAVHLHAESLREQEKFKEALKLYAQAIKEYFTSEDFAGVVDALGGQSLTYKHLYLTDPQEKYLQLCRGSAGASLEIAKKHNLTDIVYRCYFNLGEVEMLSKEYPSAITNFEKSLELLPKNSVEISRTLSHLAEAQFLNGNKLNANKNLSKSLAVLEKYRAQIDDYTYKVWKTGILMKLAVATNDFNYLNQAEDIIKSDPRLIIRHRQLAELRNKYHFSSR